MELVLGDLPSTRGRFSSIFERLLAQVVRAARNQPEIKGERFSDLNVSTIKAARSELELRALPFDIMTPESLLAAPQGYEIRTRVRFYKWSQSDERSSTRRGTCKDSRGRDLGGALVLWPGEEVYSKINTEFESAFFSTAVGATTTGAGSGESTGGSHTESIVISPQAAANFLSNFWYTHQPRVTHLETEKQFINYLQQRGSAQVYGRWLGEQTRAVATFRGDLVDAHRARVAGGEAPAVPLTIPALLVPPFPRDLMCALTIGSNLRADATPDGGFDAVKFMETLLLAAMAPSLLVAGGSGGDRGVGGSAGGEARLGDATFGDACVSQSQPSDSSQTSPAVLSDLHATSKQVSGPRLHASVGTAETGGSSTRHSAAGLIQQASGKYPKPTVVQRDPRSLEQQQETGALTDFMVRLFMTSGALLEASMRSAICKASAASHVFSEINERFVRRLAPKFKDLMDTLFSRLRVSERDFALYVFGPMKSFVELFFLPTLQGLDRSSADYVGNKKDWNVMRTPLGEEMAEHAKVSTDIPLEKGKGKRKGKGAAVAPGVRLPLKKVAEVSLRSKAFTDVLKEHYGDDLAKVYAVYLEDGNLVGVADALGGSFATTAQVLKFLGTGALTTWNRLPQLLALRPGGDDAKDLRRHLKAEPLGNHIVPSIHALSGETTVAAVLIGGDGKYIKELKSSCEFNDQLFSAFWTSLQTHLRQLLDPKTGALMFLANITHTSNFYKNIVWGDAAWDPYRASNGVKTTEMPIVEYGYDILYWDPFHLVITPAKHLLGAICRLLKARYSMPVVETLVRRFCRDLFVSCYAHVDGDWVSFNCKRSGRAAALMADLPNQLFGDLGEVLPDLAADPEGADVLADLNHLVQLFAITSRVLLTANFDDYKEGCKTYQVLSAALNSTVVAVLGPKALTPALSYRCDAVPLFMLWCLERNLCVRELGMDGLEENHKLRSDWLDICGRHHGSKHDGGDDALRGYYNGMLRVAVRMAHDFLYRAEETPGKNSKDVKKAAERKSSFLKKAAGHDVFFPAALKHILRQPRDAAKSSTSNAVRTYISLFFVSSINCCPTSLLLHLI